MAAASLAACASISQNLAATMSQMPAIGLPAGAPERPDEPPPYPAVHDMPLPRASTLLSATEQQKVEDDLSDIRDRHMAMVGLAIPVRKKPKEPGRVKGTKPDKAEKPDKTDKTAKADKTGNASPNPASTSLKPAASNGTIY